MKDAQFTKLVLFTSSLVPAAMMAWDWADGMTGADPGFYLMRNTGILAFIFLLLSLAVTPLRRITGKNYWSLFRRMLGLYAFFYACLHLLCFVFVYKGGDLKAVVDEILNRKFIFFGMGAFLLMVPLAATSTVGAIKRLGNKRWKLLHKLVYICVTAAAIHYLLAGKLSLFTENLITEPPFWFAAIAAALLLFRLVAFVRDRYLPKAPKNARPALAAK